MIGAACENTNRFEAPKMVNYANEDNKDKDEESSDSGSNSVLKIHTIAFDELGDCTVIQAQGKTIMIDCGAEGTSSRKILLDFLNNNEIKKIDYLIITHQDLDHVNCFLKGVSGLSQWFLEGGRIDTLIDFDIANDSTITNTAFPGKSEIPSLVESATLKSSEDGLYSITGNTYRKDRDFYITSKFINLYYTASQLTFRQRTEDKWLSENANIRIGLNKTNVAKIKADITKQNKISFKDALDKVNFDDKKGASNVFNLGKSFSLKILYNRYGSYAEADEPDDNGKVIPKYEPQYLRNRMSVCSLITYGEDKFLFTGDLPEFTVARDERDVQAKEDNLEATGKRLYGETHLVETNYDDLKDGVMFFRGGHHGSSSSNSNYFLSVIRPQYVSWSGIAGISALRPSSARIDEPGTTNRFPSSNSINNVGRYTDKIFYTKMFKKFKDSNSNDEDEDQSVVFDLHGNTVFTYNPYGEIGQRMTVVTNYDYEKKAPLLDAEPDSFFLTSFVRNNNERWSPAYIYNLTSNNVLFDNPVDCTYIKVGHIDILIGGGYRDVTKARGIDEVIEKIKYLCNDKVLDYVIVPSNHNISTIITKKIIADRELKKGTIVYHDQCVSGLEKNLDNIKKAISQSDGKGLTIAKAEGKHFLPLSTNEVMNNYSDIYLEFLPQTYNREKGSAAEDNSIATVFNFRGFRYLNVGIQNNFDYLNNEFFDLNEDSILNKIDSFQAPQFGEIMSGDPMELYQFVRKITSKRSENHHGSSKYEDEEAPKSRSGLFLLINSTVNELETEYYIPSLLMFAGDFKYNIDVDSTSYKLMAFPTLKFKNESSIVSSFNNMRAFYRTKVADKEKEKNECLNGDICLRTLSSRLNSYEYKVRFGVSQNYSDKKNGLLFYPTYIDDGNKSMKYENRYNNAKTIDEFLTTSGDNKDGKE